MEIGGVLGGSSFPTLSQVDVGFALGVSLSFGEALRRSLSLLCQPNQLFQYMAESDNEQFCCGDTA